MVPVIGRTTVRVRKEAENVSHDNPSELFAESASVAEGRDVGVCNECRAPEFEPGRVITERYGSNQSRAQLANRTWCVVR
jgi:hypothetical protein